eukprot:30845-Pelagococcus_subviridis.AAC.7
MASPAKLCRCAGAENAATGPGDADEMTSASSAISVEIPRVDARRSPLSRAPTASRRLRST